MKSVVENLSNLEKKITVEVPLETVKAEFLQAYKYLQKNVELKGFRKGKAPIETIRKMYADKIQGDVAQNLVQNAYVEALKENDLTPIGMPNLDFGQASEEAAFSFTAQFEVQPEIEIKKTEGLKVQKEKLVIEDEQLEKTMDQIREGNTKLEDVKLIREAQEGDVAVFDFDGFIDDKPLEGGSAKDHNLEIGSKQFIPGFEEGLIGLKPGDNKSIHLSFPEDYHVENLKGKKVVFKVAMKGLKKKVLPDWNDAEFLKSLGDYNSLDDFKAKLKENLSLNEEERIKKDLKTRLFKELIKENPFETPQTLLNEQRKMLVEDFRGRLKQQGFTEKDFAEYQKKWDSDFDDTAAFMVQSALIIQKLAKDNDLIATNSDLDAKYQEMADQMGMPVEEVKQFYGSQPNNAANLQFQITEDRVFDFLLAKAEVEEVDKSQLADLADQDKPSSSL